MSDKLIAKIGSCSLCGEDAILISYEGDHWVRVRRISKCKRYLPPAQRWAGKLNTCQTAMHKTAEDAIAEWNNKQRAEALCT